MRDRSRDIDDLDDGRTIASMSGVGDFESPVPTDAGGRDIREELGSKEEQFMLVLGTLKAGLSLGMVYVVVFGIVIALMVMFWT